MKKRSGFLYIGIPLMILFITVAVIVFEQCRNIIEKGYLASEGNAAQNFAALSAANIHLTDEQVDSLKKCTYAELMASEENKQLEIMMRNDSFSQKVDYAYVMIHLNDDDVKYSVTDETKSRYNAPVGTKLDIMWLLDVNVNTETESADADEYYRYSYYIDEDDRIFKEAPTYLYHSSEWGNHICGYAPLFSTSGQYIGVLGIELQTGDYDSYCGKAVLAMRILLSVSLLLLTTLFLYIFFKNRKAQYDRIFLDPLTGVYNRSYYNSRFTKSINRKRKGSLFALMIADVDWFKKVNDTFGHDIGDDVLIELGEILTEVCGKSHVIRFGGEEFVVGMRFDSKEDIIMLSETLFQKISNHKFTTREIDLTISLGCAYATVDSVNGWLISEMLRCADCKLYEAKESGRNRYYIEKFDKDVEYVKNNKPKMTAEEPEYERIFKKPKY